MNTRLPTFLALAALTGQATALTVMGMVEGTTADDVRISGFVVSSFGQPVQELLSVTVKNGKFKLEIPASAPNEKAPNEKVQMALIPQNISWTGVIDPVTVSKEAKGAELKFFSYHDVNKNNSRDDNEPLREITLNVGRASLFVEWVNIDVQVTANKGYQAFFKKGWNALLVEVGRTVNVQPFDEDTVVNVKMIR